MIIEEWLQKKRKQYNTPFDIKLMRKISLIFLGLILLLGFALRLYRLDSPIADWHAWRQADTASVSRNFVQDGIDLLHPRFDDLSNVASGKDNPNGYRFVEFPIYNLFQAVLFKQVGTFSLEEWGRLVTIFSSLLSSLFIFLLLKKYSGDLSAFLGAFFYNFLPFNIYFGRTILPDTMMVMAILGGTYFFDKWVENTVRQGSRNKFGMTFFLILSIIFTASAFLLKPYALFFTLPIIYIAFKNFRLRTLLKWEIWLFAILTIAPLAFWRNWILQYPEGIPVTKWLFNEGNIRFKGAYFQWLFGDRIARLIFGYWALPIFVLGLLNKIKKENTLFFFSFLASSLLYVTVIAKGNVQHDYYQILITPSLVIFLALGGEFLIKAPKEIFSKKISISLFVVCTVFSLSFGWYFVRDFFNINNPSMVKAGQEIDRLIPKDAKVIAVYNGDTAFLYQTKRKGWASQEKSFPEMVEMGANYLILPNPQEKDFEMGKEFKIISSSSDYILFSLNDKP